MHTSFRSGSLQLEGELVLPSACAVAAVICHPHPQYGGDMDNGIVALAATVLQELGFATLRFNFRGVGASDGCFDHGVGEVDDALAAVHHLRDKSGLAALTLVGYSFGAMVALRAGPIGDDVDRIIAIAPPLAFFDLRSLADCRKTKLFAFAEDDRFCDATAATQQIAELAAPTQHRVVAAADHFFSGKSAQLTTALRELLTA
jgi:hypothetical protein